MEVSCEEMKAQISNYCGMCFSCDDCILDKLNKCDVEVLDMCDIVMLYNYIKKGERI